MGWIKLDRQIQDNFLWFDEPFTKAQAWIDLLLLANHEDGEVLINGKYQKIKRGQHLTSTIKLANRWKWSRNKVYRFLVILQNANMVKKRTLGGTLLTIVNYDKYQSRWYMDETPNGTPLEAEVGAEVGTQTRRIKKNKEDKKASPLSYQEEREQLYEWMEKWAAEGDENEQDES